ncbi:MAG: methyltransferase domain-containing protein [Phycisphaerae bacterium]|nr:methyltransferase domain-containing protein [Phycisphaerae bacterium]
MAESAVQRFYRRQAPLYDWTRWLFLHGRSRAVELLGVPADGWALDVGCGTGLNFGRLQQRLDARRGGRIIGLDLSVDMLRRAGQRVTSHRWSNVALIAGDASRIRLMRAFDAILFAYSLTMIANWQGAIDRAWEHLRPGGRLVVLDFGTFEGWGPAGRALRNWMQLHHVEPCRPYVARLAELSPGLQVAQRLGGYYYTAVAVKSGP